MTIRKPDSDTVHIQIVKADPGFNTVWRDGRLQRASVLAWHITAEHRWDQDGEWFSTRTVPVSVNGSPDTDFEYAVELPGGSFQIPGSAGLLGNGYFPSEEELLAYWKEEARRKEEFERKRLLKGENSR